MGRGKKRRRNEQGPRGRFIPGLPISACLGMLCLILAHAAFCRLARPDLEVRLKTPDTGDRLILTAINTGTRDIRLDLANVRCLLVPVPRFENRYVIHLADAPPAGRREAAENAVLLRPGAEIELCDVTRRLERLPAGRIHLSAVFSLSGDSPRDPAGWTGFVRSPPLEIVKT